MFLWAVGLRVLLLWADSVMKTLLLHHRILHIFERFQQGRRSDFCNLIFFVRPRTAEVEDLPARNP